MKNRLGLVVLIIVCAVLSIALIWTQKQSVQRAGADEVRIGNYSNQLVATTASLDQQRQVSTALEGDLNRQREAFAQLTNSYTQVTANLGKTEASLQSVRQVLATREARINDLESQNQALDQRAVDLSGAITNLTAQIEDTRNKLAASEGDKAFLERELQRLMAEKADLERQFNDLNALRVQVAKLKEELNVSRRLQWIREGLFTRADQKGAEQLMQKNSAPTETKPATYDLNVEVSADGTVRVIPALTNPPAAPPAGAKTKRSP
jgi:chromosome segregation ATPase